MGDVLESTMKQDNPPSEVTVLQYFDAGWGRQILGSFLTILMPWTLFFSKHGLCDKPAGIYHATGDAKTCLQFVAEMDLESTLGVQVLAHRGGSREPLLPATGKTVREILDSCVRHPSEPDASDSAETRQRKIRKRREQEFYYGLDGSMRFATPEMVARMR